MFNSKLTKRMFAVGLLAVVFALGCSPAGGEEQAEEQAAMQAEQPAHAESEPEVTYLALDTTPLARSKSLQGFQASAGDGWKFKTYRDQYSTYEIVVESTDEKDRRSWVVRLRAPNNELFQPGLYADVEPPGSGPKDKPWLSLTVGSSAPNYSAGWFRIHEADFAADRTHFAVDFFLVDFEDEKMFGRLRYNARVDPQPTAEEIAVLLYGERGAALRRLGFEPVETPNVLGLEGIFYGRHHRHAASHEEYMKEVIGRITSHLPEVEEGKELWYDPESHKLYIRPIGQEP
jgi:hypothetical protein